MSLLVLNESPKYTTNSSVETITGVWAHSLFLSHNKQAKNYLPTSMRDNGFGEKKKEYEKKKLNFLEF